MRLVSALGALVIMAGVLSLRSEAMEQTVTILNPPEEQRVEVLNAGHGQRVEGVDSGAVQGVYENEIPSEAERTANNVGKVALSVTAAAVSLGVMAASLLLL